MHSKVNFLFLTFCINSNRFNIKIFKTVDSHIFCYPFYHALMQIFASNVILCNSTMF